APFAISRAAPPGFSGDPFTLGIASGGYSYTDVFFGLPRTSPLVAVLSFGDTRPHGMDKEYVISDVNAGFGAYIYNSISLTSQFNAPLIVPNSSNTIWRDIDIHPRTGVIAARANNSLVITERVSTVGPNFNLAAGDASIPSQVRRKRIDLTGMLAGNAGIIGHRVNILHGSPVGDLVIVNDRSSTAGGQNFTDVVKIFQLTPLTDGAGILDPVNSIPQATVTYVDSTGATPTFPTGIGMYDFAWVEDTTNPANSRLLVLDAGSSRNVYVFSIVPPAPTCRLDYNQDGSVNPDDIGDYITDYFTAPPIAGPGGYAISCPDNPAPYNNGYKAGYTADGSGQCGEPNPDNLGDWIT
ncbi:MAG: hypothetical protein K2Q20_05705, partial [Phycisphaerales bacterium]|nr:hypothetical protein [Phycisphaerales bacterium]